MKLYFHCCLFIQSLLILACQPKSKPSSTIISPKDSTLIRSLDSVAERFLAQNDLPCAVIGLIENGRPLTTLYYGHSEVGKKQKVQGSTVFNLGSISKSLTAWGILRLVEKGEVVLDSPATKYIKTWEFPPHNFDESKITVLRLLGHNAGLSLSGYPGFKNSFELPSTVESLNGLTNGPGRVEVVYEPGTEFRYSGGGFTVLQLLIEETTQMSFSEYMTQYVFIPLDMKHSTFETIDDAHPLQPNLAKPYNGKGKEIIDLNFTARAAAGLRSTSNDMIQFILAELQSGTKSILDEKWIQLMHKPNSSSERYGLGHQVRPFKNKKIIGHVGNNQGWHSNFEFIPETKSGIVVLTNGNDGFYFHNTIMCQWISHQTGERTLEFCATLPLAKIGKLQEMVLDWYTKSYITPIQRDTLHTRFHEIRIIGPSDIKKVIRGLNILEGHLSDNYPDVPKSHIKEYGKISQEVIAGLNSVMR